MNQRSLDVRFATYDALPAATLYSQYNVAWRCRILRQVGPLDQTLCLLATKHVYTTASGTKDGDHYTQ